MRKIALEKGYGKWLIGKKVSLEHRQKISEAHKGTVFSGEHRRKLALGRLGKRHSEKAKKILSDLNKGKKMSAETRAKISASLKGKNTWSKGKKTGSLNPFYGKNHSEETKKLLSQHNINFPRKIFKDTKIEVAIENELKNRKIVYEKQKSLCGIAIVDFYIPDERTVIECDGDYWHTRPGVPEKDAIKNAVLRENGFSVFRFWEHEISKSPSECLDRVWAK